MRNITFFFGALLLMDGVFGVDVTVSVMEGDSVTLNPHTEIPEDTTVQWLFGDTRIAQINKTVVLEEKFRGKLKLDHQSGSLTITNITPGHNGLYKLQIRGTTETYNIFRVTVSDVVESLSVMEGDSVILHTGVTDIQRDDQILWKSGDKVLNGPGDTRWRNIHQNKENGEITIKNIRSYQFGDYKLEIETSSVILHRKLHIIITGKMTKVSVKEKESITLHTGLIEIKGYDLILWKFKEQLIAEINKGTNTFLTHDTSDERFKGRLQMDRQSGDLTIRGSSITDSGDYHLHMNSSTYTLERNISVTVSVSDKQTPDPGLSSGAIAGIVAVVLLVFAAAAGVIYLRWKISKLNTSGDDAVKNETNVPFNETVVVTANGEDW